MMSNFINSMSFNPVDLEKFIPLNTFEAQELNLFDTTSEQSKWLLIEKKFITDVYAAKQNSWKTLSSIIPTTFAVYSGYKFATIENQNKEEDIIKNLLSMKNLYLVGGSIASLTILTQYLDSYLSSKANKDGIVDFFNNWDENKLFVPKELYPFLDMINRNIKINGQDFITKNADKIMHAIQFIITRHFESRYKKVLELEAHNSLAEAKTISEIIKNFVASAKDLKA